MVKYSHMNPNHQKNQADADLWNAVIKRLDELVFDRQRKELMYCGGTKSLTLLLIAENHIPKDSLANIVVVTEAVHRYLDWFHANFK